MNENLLLVRGFFAAMYVAGAMLALANWRRGIGLFVIAGVNFLASMANFVTWLTEAALSDNLFWFAVDAAMYIYCGVMAGKALNKDQHPLAMACLGAVGFLGFAHGPGWWRTAK
jgi:hypothetical protein